MIKLKTLMQLKGKHCYWCGVETVLPYDPNKLKQNSPTREHLIPKSEGGTDHIDNLTIACYTCNTNRRSMSEEEFRNSEFLQHRLGYLYNRGEVQRTKRQLKRARRRERRFWDKIYAEAHREDNARSIAKVTGQAIEEIMLNWTTHA